MGAGTRGGEPSAGSVPERGPLSRRREPGKHFSGGRHQKRDPRRDGIRGENMSLGSMALCKL